MQKNQDLSFESEVVYVRPLRKNESYQDPAGVPIDTSIFSYGVFSAEGEVLGLFKSMDAAFKEVYEHEAVPYYAH